MQKGGGGSPGDEITDCVLIRLHSTLFLERNPGGAGSNGRRRAPASGSRHAMSNLIIRIMRRASSTSQQGRVSERASDLLLRLLLIAESYSFRSTYVSMRLRARTGGLLTRR